MKCSHSIFILSLPGLFMLSVLFIYIWRPQPLPAALPVVNIYIKDLTSHFCPFFLFFSCWRHFTKSKKCVLCGHYNIASADINMFKLSTSYPHLSLIRTAILKVWTPVQMGPGIKVYVNSIQKIVLFLAIKRTFCKIYF